MYSIGFQIVNIKIVKICADESCEGEKYCKSKIHPSRFLHELTLLSQRTQLWLFFRVCNLTECYSKMPVHAVGMQILSAVVLYFDLFS